jgi:hypothetical protein
MGSLSTGVMAGLATPNLASAFTQGMERALAQREAMQMSRARREEEAFFGQMRPLQLQQAEMELKSVARIESEKAAQAEDAKGWREFTSKFRGLINEGLDAYMERRRATAPTLDEQLAEAEGRWQAAEAIVAATAPTEEMGPPAPPMRAPTFSEILAKNFVGNAFPQGVETPQPVPLGDVLSELPWGRFGMSADSVARMDAQSRIRQSRLNEHKAWQRRQPWSIQSLFGIQSEPSWESWKMDYEEVLGRQMTFAEELRIKRVLGMPTPGFEFTP